MHVDHSWDVTGQGEQERVFPKKPTGFLSLQTYLLCCTCIGIH